jgi:hypothetical protein
MTPAEINLTHAQLRSMAVSPYERGAYSQSPLGPETGLHVHSEDGPVHVVVDGSKIAEVGPDSTYWLDRLDRMSPFQRGIAVRLPGYENLT